MTSKSPDSQQAAWHITLTLTLFLLLTVTGCDSNSEGPTRVSAKGKVTLDGQPLQNGMIRFIPSGATQGPKVSTAITNGIFSLPQAAGPAAGHHRVEIEAPAAGQFALDDEETLERLQQRSRRKTNIKVLKIPMIYNSHSRLTADLKATDLNNLTFELMSNPD